MAAKKAPLRVVSPGERPKPPAKKHTVATAAASGTRLDLLLATRDRIATAITDERCPPRDLAALTRRLDDIVEKIAVLEAAATKEAADSDFAADEAFDASAL